MHLLCRAGPRLAATASRLFATSSGGRRINLNADLGEGFGPWSMTADSELMKIVTSANVACGAHAGDANIMASVLEMAYSNNVSVGSHPGYDDKPGFGRRMLSMTLKEIEHLIAYQTGALVGMAGLVHARNGGKGVKVTHVKPHGALNNIACVKEDIADAIVRGIVGVDRDLIMLAPAGSELLKAAERGGLPVASEVFADRTYMSDGNLSPRSLAGSVIHDPDEAREHALRLASGLPIKALDTGADIVLKADSICVHGDKPSAVQQAQLVKDALIAEGFTLCTLPDVLAVA